MKTHFDTETKATQKWPIKYKNCMKRSPGISILELVCMVLRQSKDVDTCFPPDLVSTHFYEIKEILCAL